MLAQISLTHGIQEFHTKGSFLIHAGVIAKETLGASQMYFIRLKVDIGLSTTISILALSQVSQELSRKT